MQHEHAAIGRRTLEGDEVGLLIAGLGTFERRDREIPRAEELAARRIYAGRGAQLDGKQPGQRRRVHRPCESERDLMQIADAIGPVRWANRRWRRKQRNQARCLAFRRELDPLQRLPGIGRPELQRAGAEPLPGARRCRFQRDEALGRVLGTAAGRPSIPVEEDGHRVPATQKALRHDFRAIGPLQLVELKGSGAFGAGARRA